MKCPSCGEEGRVFFGWVERRGERFFEHLVCHACDAEFDGNELERDDPMVQGYLAEEEEEVLRNQVALRHASKAGGSFDLQDALALVDGTGQIIAMVDPILLPRLIDWASRVPPCPCTNLVAADESVETAVERTRQWWLEALMRD